MPHERKTNICEVYKSQVESEKIKTPAQASTSRNGSMTEYLDKVVLGTILDARHNVAVENSILARNVDRAMHSQIINI